MVGSSVWARVCLKVVIGRFEIGKKLTSSFLMGIDTTARVRSRIQTQAKHWHATDFNIVYYNIGTHLSTMLHWTMKDFPTTRRAALVFSSITPSDNRISADTSIMRKTTRKCLRIIIIITITMTKTITHALHIILYSYIIYIMILLL